MEKTFIFAGFGGQGMLLIGKFMAMACMLDGKHVSWLPSYGPEMRGGTANCSVIVSDDPVASPLVDKADVIVAMNRPSLDKFEEHVKPGGVLVINSSIIDRKAVRDDIQVVYCDANAIAESIGNPKGANVAILGAVLEKVPVTTVEQMTEAIRIELGERKARFLDGNKKALVAGMEAARYARPPPQKKYSKSPAASQPGTQLVKNPFLTSANGCAAAHPFFSPVFSHPFSRSSAAADTFSATRAAALASSCPAV